MENNNNKDRNIVEDFGLSQLKDIPVKELEEIISKRGMSDMNANLGVKLELPEINNYQKDILNTLVEQVKLSEKNSKDAARTAKISFIFTIIAIITSVLGFIL